MEADKIAVLGSNSFSGSHCVDYFLENTEAQVVGISRSPEYREVFLPYLYQKKRSNRFSFCQLDINVDTEGILRALDAEEPDIIINFIAQGNSQHSWEEPGDWLRTNCLSLAALACGLKDRTYFKKFIQISTPEVYGSCTNFRENLYHFNPVNPYAASKAAGDLMLVALLRTFGFPVCFVRSSNVYGSHQQLYRLIPRSIIYLGKGIKIPLHGGGRFVRSFVHIKDVARGIYKIAAVGGIGSVYHFSGRSLSIRDLVNKICERMGCDFESVTEMSDIRSTQDDHYDLNCHETSLKLDWRPEINLSDGLSEVINWIESNWQFICSQPLEYIHQK